MATISDTQTQQSEPPSLYAPLPHARCIRLMEVLAYTPQDGEKLVLEMTVLDLDTVREVDIEDDDDRYDSGYDALSYTWGPPRYGAQCEERYSSAHDVPIRVLAAETYHPNTVMIGRNLYEALFHLYALNPRRSLWIDRLCINQEDQDEKTDQIRLMADIYSRAAVVMAWMGMDEPGDDTFGYVEWLHNDFLVEAYNLDSVDHITLTWDYALKASYIAEMNILLKEPVLQALFRFYAQTRYLARAWVVQEVALARRAVCMVGHRMFRFERLWQFLSKVYIGSIGAHFPTIAGSENVSLGGDISRFAGARMEYRALRTPGTVAALSNVLDKLFGVDDNDTPLAWLESKFHCRTQGHASDPRDIIFSMLGMLKSVVSENKLPLRFDYTLSAEEIYISLASQSLQTMPYRAVLSIAGVPKDGTNPKDSISGMLPSWVPNYGGRQTETPTLQVTEVLQRRGSWFEAGFDDQAPTSIKIDGKELHLFARRCGAINKTHRFESASDVTRRSWATGVDVESQCLLGEQADCIAVLSMCVQFGAMYANEESTVLAMFRALYHATPTALSDAEATQLIRGYLSGFTVGTVPIDNPSFKSREAELLELYDKLADDPCIPEKQTVARLKHYIEVTQTRNFDLSSPDGVAEAFAKMIDGMQGIELAETVQEWTKLQEGYNSAFKVVYSDQDSLFTTDNKYIGHMEGIARPGDELWLICHARVPFVLRPTGDGKYRIVGEAFVHGAMFGELITNGVAGDAHEITII